MGKRRNRELKPGGINMIAITPEAIQKAKQLQEGDDTGLRVKVQGGGCSGLEYVLSFDYYNDNDVVLWCKNEKGEDDFHLICDKRSILYVAGSQIIYQDGLMASGFAVENPNANSTCGCGESFSI